MRTNSISPALRDCLGHEATLGLLDLVESTSAEERDRMLNVAADRFERRLAEELGALRVALVREIHETRSEMLKWAFVFWVSQVTAFGAFLFFVYRSAPH
jgi:hypothetical protein